jgi:NADH-quinone oxidoreductase subunit A
MLRVVAIDYLPLLILVVVACIFGFIAIGMPTVLGPTRPNKQKLEPYESGIIPYHDARRRFPIKYYLVAMLFLLFDIEVIFMYPWAAILRVLRDNYSIAFTLVPMGFFLLVLVVGFLYEWKKGALTWD